MVDDRCMLNNSLFSFDLDSINTVSWTVLAVTILFFVDGEVFGSARTVFTLLFVDVDLFLAAAAGKSSREGGVTLLVTFTSGASTGFSFDFHTS